MLQMYLAQTSYNLTRFQDLASELLRWVDPSLNPEIGCAECYQHFAKSVDALYHEPPYDQEAARRWLVATMNKVNERVGKMPLTYEEASQQSHWL